MVNESTKWLYEQLTRQGYNVGKDLGEFEGLMKTNAQSRQWAYETAKKSGLNVGKDIDEFTSLVAPPAPKPAQQPAPKPAQQPAPKPAQQPAPKPQAVQSVTQGAPTEATQQVKQELTVTKPAAHQPVAKQNTATSVAGEPTRYFRLRRGGSDFVVSEAEVKAAGGLKAWADKHHGAPVRVYMSGTDKDGKSFNGHVSIDEAHKRRVENGYRYNMTNGTSYPEQVAAARQSDRIEKVLDGLWSEAEANTKKDIEAVTKSEMDNYVMLGGGRENRMVASAGMAHGKQVAYLRNFDIEKMAQNAVNRLSSNNGAGGDASRPLTEEEKRQQEEFYQQVYNQVYNYAVAKNAPKSTVEFFMRKVMDANVLASISKGLARSAAGVGDGLIKANEQAMGEYEKKHRAVGIMGTVTGMAIDPVTAVSALAGGAVAKGAISIGGKIIAPKVAAPVASRLFASTAAGRVTGAIAGSVGNFATYEGIKDAEMQFKHGGHINAETGETEGYSLGSVGNSMLHGAGIGAVMGVGGTLVGNVADKAVKATTSTAGKVGVRAAEFGAGTVLNGTIFAADGYMQSGEFDLLHGIATDLGFKASHAIKTAPQRIASMRPIANPRTMAERNHNRMSFEEHLRKNLDASPADTQFTKEEREELRCYGYGELADVFAKTAKPKEATIENPNNLPEVRIERSDVEEIPTGGEFDGYDAMERLTQDGRVPETIRAKAYYIFTGKAVPVSTVIGYREERNDEDGIITVNSVNAQGGVVTSRRFKDEKQAEAERNNIMRQAELNTIDMGERFKEAEADEKVLQSAINKVSPGADYATVKQIYKDVKSGKEGITDSQRQLASAIDMALEHSKGEADADRPAAIRERLNKELNGDVEGALKKISTDRTEAEQALVERYAEELYPKQEKTPQQEEAESMHQYGKELYGRVYEGDSDARADIEAINVRVEEARGMCAEAFGDDAEYWLGRLDENPWDVVDMPTLTEGQRDAALYYINSKAAQEGVQAAQADAIEARRAEVESSVRRRTHRDRGTIQPAVMKVDDRRVYVVKGDVVMFPDGTAVDHNNSSESIIVCDAETGEFRFASPWDILRMEEAVDPQVELDAAFAQIDAEESELLSPSESVPNIEENPDEAVSALSRIPVDEQTGEPLFEQAPDHETAWDGLLEAVGGDTKDAVEIAQAQADAIAVELRKLAGKAPRLSGSPMQMAAQKREHQGKIEALQGRLEIWNGILGVNNTREAAERERLHDEAQRRFEERQRIEAEDAAEQATVGTNAVNPKIKAKWENANKVEGVEDVLTLADGSTIRGRYVLTEAGAATASHDVNNAFAPSEGFPIDRNGQSVNDRDYERDMDAQRIVQSIADSYDNRALQTPVIVSRDGIVLSGNNRTMSGDMAARQGTDKAYVDYLREFAGKYGFTPEQVEGMKNPRVAFVPNEDLPYDASTFARFNAQEMKSQSKPEAAVKLGKTVPDDVFNGIVNEISCYDRLSEYYANERAVAQALGALQQAGVINEKQMPEMRTGAAVSAAGRELIENTLIGKVFQASPDAVRQIIGNVTLREAIIMGLTEIASNRTLANGYDLSDELAKAVNLVTRAKASLPDVYKRGVPVSPFGRQTGLFDDEFGDGRVTDGVVLMLADVLNSGKPSELRKMLVAYNREAQSAASGQMDIFSGAVPPKEEVMNLTIESFRNATPKEQQAIVDAAIADRKRRAAQRAGAETAGEAVDAAESEVQPSAESRGASLGGVDKGNAGLTTEEAEAFISKMERVAEDVPNIELTPDNWKMLFGDDGRVVTPLGTVKMGDNQLAKLWLNGRGDQLGMIKPTLESPHVIVEVPSSAKDGDVAERETSYLFIRSFKGKDGKKVYFFKSVTVRKDGMEVSVSSHLDRPKRVKESLEKGKLLYRFDDGAQTEQNPASASVTVSPLARQGGSNDKRKGSKSLSEKQAEDEKSLIGLADSILEKMSEAAERERLHDEAQRRFEERQRIEAEDAAEGKTGDVPTGISGDARGMGDRSGDMGIEKSSLNQDEDTKAGNNNKFDRTIPATVEEQRGAIDRIIAFARSVKDRVQRAVIGGITTRQMTDLKNEGIEIDETWVHSFESSAVSHNQGQHGDTRVEERMGQIAITSEDYARIPEILETYDRVTKSPNRSRSTGNEVIIYEKEFDDGYVYYLEEKRDKRKSLSFQTMYKKKKGTDSSDGLMPNASPSTPTAPSDNFSSNSGGKVSKSLSEKQAEDEKSLIGLADSILEKMSEAAERERLHDEAQRRFEERQRIEAEDAAEGKTGDVPTGISGDARGMGDRSGDMGKIQDKGVKEWYAKLRLSGELDENGRPFIASQSGGIDFGNITAEHNLPAAPVRLSMGDVENGYIHINFRHGQEIKDAGFASIEQFVSHVIANATRIQEGAAYDNAKGNKNQTYIVQAIGDKNNTLFIQLSRNGEYWNVNSAGVFKKNYGKNKRNIWSASAQQNGVSAHTDNGSQSEPNAEEGSTSIVHPSNASSGRKGSKFLSKKQAEDEKSLIGLADGILEKMSEADARRLSELNRRIAELEAEHRAGKYREIELSEAGDELLALTDEFDVEELDMIAVKYPAAIRRVGYARDRRAAEKRSREVLEMRKNEEMNALRELYDKAEPLPAHDKKPKKFAVTEYVSTDKRDPKHFFGVYHSSTGEAVATDKAVLIVSKADYKPEHKGKVVTKKGEDVTNDLRSEMLSEHGAKYVDYTRVIPTGEAEATAPLSDAAVQAACGVTVKKRNEAYIILDFGEGRLISMDMYNWQLFVRGANYIGATEVEYRGEDRPLIARSEKGAVLSMPIQYLRVTDKPIYRQDLQAADAPKNSAEGDIPHQTDNQGNYVDAKGKLITEPIYSIDEITDEDFVNPKRSIKLPELPENVADAIGTAGKPVIIKRNILGKNRDAHKDLTPEQSREILKTALYTPTLYGKNQAKSRPANWILIHLADKNSAVVLEIDHNKDNCEVVNWHHLGGRQLEQKIEQAEREGGRILTLGEPNAAGNTSQGLQSVGKGTKKSGDAQEGGEGMEDSKPLSKEDIREAIAPNGAKPKAPKKPANRVSIEEVMLEPEEQPKAEQKPADEGSKLVMDDDTKASEDILRNLLGIDDNDFDDSVFLREGDIKLTPAQRKQVYAAGVNYALWYIDNGFVKFDDFAAAMSKRLGEKIKPWLKSFYNGARDIPGYENVEFTPYEEVKRFDVANFDKPTPEMLKQAEMVLAEHKAKKAAAQAAEELKK